MSMLRKTTRRWVGVVVLLVGLFGAELMVEAAPHGPRIFAAGQQALSRGEYDKALKLLRQAVKLLPHWGYVHLEYARALRFTGGEAKLIETALRNAQRLLPQTNPRVHMLAGLFWEGQGESTRALRHYSQAMSLGHNDPRACLRAARLWLSIQQGGKAVFCLRRLLSRQQSVADTHHLLAQALTQIKQIAVASKHWILALSHRPLSPILLQKVYLFYAQHTPSRPRKERYQWKRTLRQLERRLKRLLPKRRKMRMLLPSKR